MLDGFEILSTSGVVLWSKSYAPVSNSIINGFIKDVFIEEKVISSASLTEDASAAKNPIYKKDQYTLRWTSVKDLGLVFVVGICRSPKSEEVLSLTRLPTRPSTSLYSTSHGSTSFWTTFGSYLWIFIKTS